MLDQLVAAGDPHAMLETIRGNGTVACAHTCARNHDHGTAIPLSARHAYYLQWRLLVATRSPVEREQLISIGQPVFRYRTETARREIEELARTAGGGGESKIAATIPGDDFMAEVIHVPGSVPSIKFLIYREGQAPEIADRVPVGPITYIPPSIDALVDAKALILPTGIPEDGECGTTLDLMAEIQVLLNRFVAIDEDFAKFSALYALYTWIFDKVPIAPYFNAVGDFSTGKSTWLTVMGQIVYRGFAAAGVLTPPALYRGLTLCPSTMLVDESDFDPRSSMWQTMRTVLNVGNTKRSPIITLEGNDNGKWAPKAFTSFGPKVLAMRHPFPDSALASRSIQEVFRSRDIPVDIPLILDQELDEVAKPLRNKLLLWRFRNYRNITLNTRERLEKVAPRVTQIALALLTTCPEGDTEHRQLVLKVAQQLSEALNSARAQSLEGFVAAGLYKAWKDKQYKGPVLLSGVVDRVKTANDDYKEIRNEKVSTIVRGPLGFKTFLRGGYSHIETPLRKMRDLAEKYEIEDERIPPRRVPVPRDDAPVMAASLASENGGHHREPVA